MKKSISYVVAVLFASTLVALASPDTAAWEAREKSVWQAFKDKKGDAIKKLLSPKVRAVYAQGINTLQDELDSMGKADMKSVTFSDFNVIMTDKDTAMVTYKVKVEATMGGNDVSGDYNAGSVWQMKNGEWIGIFHTEMKAEAPPAG